MLLKILNVQKFETMAYQEPRTYNFNNISKFCVPIQFFLTRIVDDMSTAIRDHFRSLPDEFVTGPLVDKLPMVQAAKSQSSRNSAKDHPKTTIQIILLCP